ncbi:hypothetical protein BDZ97DRAFT_602005 [Flammula alnicola]|nr:hypothetical protein BDZ97DRAFT_602005 [Flammula alnicola]
MSQTSEAYDSDSDNPPTPPPPEYDASSLTSPSFNLSVTRNVMENHAFSKPNNDATWAPPPMISSSPEAHNGPENLPDDIPTQPSKFADKLHTNYLPSTTEITEIKEYVSSVNDKVSAYDARIAELEAALQEMTKKRTRLQEVARAHEGLVSPLRRLPPEILQDIFVWCLPQNRNAVMHASEAPVLLGRVCSEWRRISIGTPEVWSSLHIVPPNVNFSNPTSSTARFQRKRDLIEMWLGRSGACPLSVSLVWFAGDSEEEIKLCGTLLEVLVPLCGRWKVLDFQVPLKMFKPFIGLTVKDVPLLEGMSLMDNRTPLDADAVDRWPESLKFAESATKLRNFTLTFFSGGIRLPTIPWAQLTDLYLESNIAFFFRDSREMLSTLAECASLQSCTLKFPLSHTASLPAYDKLDMPIVLPQLQVLCVDGDQHLHNTFHMSNTLMNLCAPKLRKLEILGRSGRPEGSMAPEPLGAIRTLLQRSKCPLEKLNIESMTMLPEEFIVCLRLIPSLVDLVVHNWSVRVLMGPPVTGEEEAALDSNEVAENQILKALTLSRRKETLTSEIPGESSVAVATPVAVADTGVGELTTKPPIPIEPHTSSLKDDTALTLSWIQKTDGLKETVVDEIPREYAVAAAVIADVGEGEIAMTTISEMAKPREPSSSSSSPSSSSSSSSPPPPDDDTPLCPNLQRFDFTLCDASQNLLCDFVSSRWTDLPEGVAQIKTVKCNFTAFEDEKVKECMQRFRTEGLDAFITYQVPINDDMNPSPWTGLEGPP